MDCSDVTKKLFFDCLCTSRGVSLKVEFEMIENVYSNVTEINPTNSCVPINSIALQARFAKVSDF